MKPPTSVINLDYSSLEARILASYCGALRDLPEAVSEFLLAGMQAFRTHDKRSFYAAAYGDRRAQQEMREFLLGCWAAGGPL